MRVAVRSGFASLLAFSLVGCASVAKIGYKPITAPDSMSPDIFDTYLLQTNKIVISAEEPAPKPAATKAVPTPAQVSQPKITVSSLPTEESGIKLGVILKDDFWTKSKINFSKIENTDLLKEAGVEVTNNAVSLINQIGDLAKAVIPLVASFAVADPFFNLDKTPVEIDTWRILKGSPNRLAFQAPVADYPGLRMVIGAVPPDAIEYGRVSWSQRSSQLLYAACREATVTLHLAPPLRDQSFTVKIADPNFIQRVALPFKGKVIMHSQCGASVQTDTAQDETTALTVATALATQGKAVADAIKAAKKTDAK